MKSASVMSMAMWWATARWRRRRLQLPVAIAVAQGEQVSWSALSTNTYQPQKSSDNSSWTNVGGILSGSTVTSVYETSPLPYYRVLEFIPGGPGRM